MVESLQNCMVRAPAHVPQVSHHLVWPGADCGIGGVAEHTNATVDRDRRGRPSISLMAAKPLVGIVVIRMRGIEKGNQNVDVE